MELLTLWSLIGFLLAAYAVIANDSVQTLGTWMASNNERFNYKTLWAAASAVLLATLWYGWSVNGGDISYGRLNKIPWQEVQWYHAAAPAILVALTRLGAGPNLLWAIMKPCPLGPKRFSLGTRTFSYATS